MSASSLELYKKMCLIRRSEELIIKYYPEDEMRTPMHMSMGQEAIPVAVCHALGPEGQVYGFYRSHALFLAKTCDPRSFFGELYGKVTGTAHGKAGSMHLASPEKGFMCASAVVAASIPLAIGAAYANKRKRSGTLCCVFFGDGAMEEGVFWESLNAACVMQLPVLFVCEDNGLAVHSKPDVRRGFKRITDIVRHFECATFEATSNDVEVLHDLTLTAIESIRKSGKPAFLDLKCYRYLGHIGIVHDFNIGYRPASEYEEWLKQDSIALQRKRLLENGFPEAKLIAEENELETLLMESISKAKAAPLPMVDELYRGVFHETD